MSLNIKNAETESLAREVATITGESLTGAITEALRQRLTALRRSDDARNARLEALRAIADDAGPRWTGPWATAEHGDLLYDDLGLPR